MEKPGSFSMKARLFLYYAASTTAKIRAALGISSPFSLTLSSLIVSYDFFFQRDETA